jgi:hypothetical protein
MNVTTTCKHVGRLEHHRPEVIGPPITNESFFPMTVGVPSMIPRLTTTHVTSADP